MKNKYIKFWIVLILIVILVAILIYILPKRGILKNTINLNKQEIIKDISFDVYSNENDKIIVLVTVEDSENKIKQLTYKENGKEKTINTYLKEKVSIDYQITSNGEYTFKAINGVGETIEKTLVIDDNTRDNLIRIDTKSDRELGTKLDVNIEYTENNRNSKNEYKIGNSTKWQEYSEKFTITSYDIIEAKSQDNDEQFTIYAKIEDAAKNKVIISKKIVNLDLKLQEKPIITTEGVEEYPILTKDGVCVSGTINIQYDNNYETDNYYSLDNGDTWQKYTGTIITSKSENITRGTILAKSVKRVSGLENISKQEIPLAENSLGINAYDGDYKTEIKGPYGSEKKLEQYLNIDETAYLREYEITQNTKNDGSCGSPSMNIYFYDDNNEIIGNEYKYQNVGSNYKSRIVCPKGAKYLKIILNGSSGWGGSSYCSFKEISVVEDNKIIVSRTKKIYPVIEKNGVILPNNITIDIRYPENYKNQYYKIGENTEWIACDKNISINSQINDKIYTKGIDIDGNEQNRDVYTVELEDDAILPKAYDGDESTFYLAGNAVTKNIEISETAWNKQLKILSKGYQIVSFLDKDGNVLYKKTHRQKDTTYTIPENTTSMKYYFNESGGIYEMKIIE